MAHITAQEVATKRAALKAAFPGWKFSVRTRHHSTVDVAILAAPVDLLDPAFRPYRPNVFSTADEHAQRRADERARGTCDVNHYHFADTWTGEALDALSKILEILNEGNFDKSDIMTDYHHVGFYVSLSVGEWRKPFVCTAPAKQAAA